MISGLDRFEEIWCVDFEFQQPPGERPNVLCMVAIEYFSDRRITLWRGEFPDTPPFRTDDDKVLFVAFFASAELNCFRALGWEDPKYILDLWVEHAWLKNNRPLLPEHQGRSLLVALHSFGVDHLPVDAKDTMRQLIMRGGAFTVAEKRRILDYCEMDVIGLIELLPRMDQFIDYPRALLRGRYMAAVSEMETRGVPIDVERFEKIREFRGTVRLELIDRIDPLYRVFEDGIFKLNLFARYLYAMGMLSQWPRTAGHQVSTSSDTMREMARTFPVLEDLKEVLATDRLLKANKLAVGSDGRNRCLLSPFGSRTGRNQPSNSQFIFGPACWLRGLIRSREGYALAYVDWSQQEIGIAAKLSGDPNLIESYASGDPYLAFARLADAGPDQRDLFKQCMLAVNYGMGEGSLARRINGSVAKARHLLQLHRGLYGRFWEWSDAAVNHCLVMRYIDTVLGWRLHLDDDPNVRSLANFACQANGAEMMRVAAILMTERRVPVCAPVHDAFVIEAPADDIDHAVAECQRAMRDASMMILDGFALRSDAQIVRHPGRYMDKRGERVWGLVEDVLTGITTGRIQQRLDFLTEEF